MNYELKIAGSVKHNPKMSYSYVRAKRKVNKSVAQSQHSKRTEKPLETAEVPFEYFAFGRTLAGTLTESLL